MLRCLAIIGLLAPVLSAVIGLVLHLMGWRAIEGWLVFLVLAAVFLLTLAMTVGMGSAVVAATLHFLVFAPALQIGIRTWEVQSADFSLALGLVGGSVLGFGIAAMSAIVRGAPPAMNRLQVLAIGVALIQFGFALRYGIHAAGAAGAAFLASFLLWAWRIPLFIVECAWQASLYAVQRGTGWMTIRWTPIRVHEAASFPYPLLERHLLDTMRRDPRAAAEVANWCLTSFAQRGTGITVLAEIELE